MVLVVAIPSIGTHAIVQGVVVLDRIEWLSTAQKVGGGEKSTLDPSGMITSTLGTTTSRLAFAKPIIDEPCKPDGHIIEDESDSG